MDKHYQLAIIGAGPAGLAAACLAAEHDVHFALLDEQPGPGGQIYRSIENVTGHKAKVLGEDYLRGRQLLEDFRRHCKHYFPNTQVWSLDSQREIGLTHDGQARTIRAEQVLVAGGAMERPVPFPGWTLPGVMYAGAGQILLKSAGLVPEDEVVLAGSGPLLLLLAWQYCRAGVKIKALLDLTPPFNVIRALPHLPRALKAHHYLTKGLMFQRELKRAGVPLLKGVSELRAEGEKRLESVSFLQRGQRASIPATLLLTHFGVIPHIWLTQAAGCRHLWDQEQQCWRPQLDVWGNTTIEGILVAGDGAGIGGARAAEYAGRIAAIQALHALGRLNTNERNRLAEDDRKLLATELAIRPFLEAYFKVPFSRMMTEVPDETIVCRCEEVTAGQIKRAVAEGHTDSNQVKFFTRCGMGPCQGRQCANAVAQLVATTRGIPVPEAGLYRGRPPVTPLSLSQLSELEQGDQA